MKRGISALFLACFCAIAVSGLISPCSAAPDEYRAFWVDAWGNGLLNQSQVDKLLGVVGDSNSKGDIRNANCNTVFVQVRRRADVCYPSGTGEPYFSGLSPSNFNALQAIINAAHDTTGGKQRIDVHCWIVTFATSTSGGTPSPLYYQHNSPSDPDNYWVTLNDSGAETSDKALDPGHPKCEDYLTNVCMDLVKRFDIDGIHYDYIRFTGNNQGYNPASVARYNARYGLTGQPSPSNEQWKQWRRDQVTALVRKVYAKIQAVKPWVKQSGAFVTWNPSPTTSTRSAFQATRPYYDVYSDWDSWMQEGIVDIAVPMTYYNWASLPSDYTRWMNFEKDRKFNRHMIIGPGIYLNSFTNAINEILMTRSPSPSGNYADGFSGYSYRVPYNGGTWAQFAPTFTAQVTPTPANIPTMPWKTNPTTGHISGTVTYAPSGTWADGALVSVTGPENRSMLCDGTGFYAFIDLTPGTYTVTASKPGYPSAERTVTVAIGQVTGNMYVTDFTLGGTGAPVISNVQASNITDSRALISWTTDQGASTQVQYGLSTSYGSLTPLDSTPVTSHTVTLLGLSPNTTYHYRVISTNANGTTASPDCSFSTNGPPSISNVQVADVTATSASVTWNTNAPADGQVNYGTTASYGSQAVDPTTGTSHSISLTGLAPTTTYHYQCVSSNAYGTAQTGDLTFTTGDVSAETIVDNTDSGWSNTSPNGNSWTAGSVSGVPKIGTNYLYAGGDGSTTQSSVTKKCRWTPNLLTAGYYDVYVYYQIGANRSSAAPYTVRYDGGQMTSIQNQYSSTPNQGGWFLVGQDLPFAAGTSGYVELTTLTTDTAFVSADAAKWVLKSSIDTTPPVVLTVTDDKYTVSTTSLNASWTGTDPESGIQRYECAVGNSSGATDVKGWTDVGTATTTTIDGLSLAAGHTYYISIRAVNGEGLTGAPKTSDGVTLAYAAGIGQAKEFPDGTPIALALSSVTAEFPGRLYVEEPSRASGIRVDWPGAVVLNQMVQVMGQLAIVDGCERTLTNCKLIPGSVEPAIQPLGMPMSAVGGASLNDYTPGVFGGIGLNNIGILARVAGKVTAVVSDGFYIDDGTGLKDDSGNTGIKVWNWSGASVIVDARVGVTGVVSCRSASDGRIYPIILARDITTY